MYISVHILPLFLTKIIEVTAGTVKQDIFNKYSYILSII